SDLHDWSINNTSSYLDLSPLYGTNQSAQDLVRNKGEGWGLLHPDTFSKDRFAFPPPTASALLVILSRNHNYVADMLLKTNECKRWTNPPPTDEKLKAQQDEEVSKPPGSSMMQDASLSEGNAWNLNAFDPITTKDGLVVERGLGNHCSVEFNVLYRVSVAPPLSAADQKWTEEAFNKVFNSRPFDELTINDFGAALGHSFAAIDPDPNKRTFGGLQRKPDGKFSDDDIAKVLLDATESPAGAYRARGTPGVLRVVEITGILQARHSTTSRSDPAITSAARRLYGHIDNLELYTGLLCEGTMPLSPGLRFASGYTVYYKLYLVLILTEPTAANLTVWGYQDCECDPHYGGFNSVYGCFPFFTPQKMKQSLTSQGIAAKYTFDRPVPTPQPKVLITFTGIKYVFNDPTWFPTLYDLEGLGNGYGFFLIFDQAAKHDADRALAMHALFPTESSMGEYRTWYRDSIVRLIKERSWKCDGVSGNYVDIVKSVNAVSVDWAANHLACSNLLMEGCLTSPQCGLSGSFKTKDNPNGLYMEQEFYEMFSILHTYELLFGAQAFTNIGENEHGFSMRWAATQAGGYYKPWWRKRFLRLCLPAPLYVFFLLLGLIPNEHPEWDPRVISTVSKLFWTPSEKPCYPFLRRLSDTGKPLNQLVATVVGLAVGLSADQAHMDVYIFEAPTLKEITIKPRWFRVMTLGPPIYSVDMSGRQCFTGLWRDVVADATIPQGNGSPSMNVKAGDRIWPSFRQAHINPTDFTTPAAVDPSRPLDSYNLNGAGFYIYLGVTYAVQTIVEIVKVVFKRKNVRRAAGDPGKLAGFKTTVNETETNENLTAYGTTSAWPGSMYLVRNFCTTGPFGWISLLLCPRLGYSALTVFQIWSIWSDWELYVIQDYRDRITIITKMSDSIAALCVRLEELDAAIETQQQVLKTLESNRTAVRRQLNGLRDPVARLPLEISSEIFIDCLPNPPDHPNPTTAPLLLLNICSSWTNVALSTTALWASLTLDLANDPKGTTEQYRVLVSGWLGRAQGRPLSLSLTGMAYSGIEAIIGQHAHQLQKLELTLTSAAYRRIFHTTATFTFLERLTIHDKIGAHYDSYDLNDSLQTFQSAPNLVECTIKDRAYRQLSEQPAATEPLHSRLRTLKIDEEGTSILQFLTLPALRGLDIAFDEDDVDSVYGRCMGAPDDGRLLRTRPYPQSSGSAEFQDNLISILTNSPSNKLLPNLTRLTIVTGPYHDNAWHATLAAMLSVRRTSPHITVKLQSFCLEYCQDWRSSRPAGPEENVKGILRGLVADGMEIFVGIDGINYLENEAREPASAISELSQ
ncbi:hypothetical protein DFH09DRAFT_1088549, partial [Mycena vulgaris]